MKTLTCKSKVNKVNKSKKVSCFSNLYSLPDSITKRRGFFSELGVGSDKVGLWFKAFIEILNVPP